MRIYVFFTALIVFKTTQINGKKCTIIKRNNFDCETKQRFVDEHNKLRNLIASGGVKNQPMAADMLEMTWHDQIATKAQRWADRCEFGPDLNLNLRGHAMGQNVLLRQNNTFQDYTNTDLMEMIDSWFEEVYQYGYTGKFSFNTSHYSQLIWATSHFLGCGFAVSWKDGTFSTFFNCYYMPVGNIVREVPYIPGEKDCRAHGFFESLSYPYLCSTEHIKRTVCPPKT